MRKLGLKTLLWAVLLWIPLSVQALGLGEIEIDSYLNQPLKAQIEVNSARPGEIDDLLISLASRDAFQKAGLDRPDVLSELKFKIEKSEDGQSATVLVTTRLPVKEPFLSFLVEADWAKGRLLREFTILLDPPSFAQQPSLTQTPPVAETSPEPVETITREPVATEPVSAPEPVEQPIALTESEAAPQEQQSYVSDEAYLADDNRLDVQVVAEEGDTLWGIASQFKDDRHSMAQMMLAIQAANPEAFGRDNINNLKVGSVLRMPESGEVDALTKQQAYAQVLEQNGLWDEYTARRSGSAVSGTPMAEEAGASTDEQAENQLSLLVPGEGDSENASQQDAGSSQSSTQLKKQLALAEEELEAAKLENDDLSSRVASLEQQLQKYQELQKMLEIEDSGLAQLQQQQTEAESLSMELPATSEDEFTDQEPAGEDSMMSSESESDMTDSMQEDIPQEDLTTESESMQDSMTSESEMVTEDGMMEDEQQGATEAETLMPTTLPPEQDSVEESPTVPAAPPVIVTTETSSGDGGVLDFLPSGGSMLTDPFVLGAIVIVLIVILLLLFIKKRKQTAAESESQGITVEEGESSATGSDDDPTPIHVPSNTAFDLTEEEKQETSGDADTSVESQDTQEFTADTVAIEAVDEEDSFAKTAIISAEEMPEAEEAGQATAEQDDVLNEADVYLAYGLYDNAEDLLSNALNDQPDRADYRAKLLDTLFALKNKDSFVAEAEALKSLGKAADPYWDRVQVMGYELVPDNDLFSGATESTMTPSDLEYAKPEAADFDIGSDDDITELGETDFDLSEGAFDLSDTQSLDTSVDEFSETLSSLDTEEKDPYEQTDMGLPLLDSEKLDDLPDEISLDLEDELNLDDTGLIDESELDLQLEDDAQQSFEETAKELDQDAELPEDLQPELLESETTQVVSPGEVLEAEQEPQDAAEPDAVDLDLDDLEVDVEMPADIELEELDEQLVSESSSDDQALIDLEVGEDEESLTDDEAVVVETETDDQLSADLDLSLGDEVELAESQVDEAIELEEALEPEVDEAVVDIQDELSADTELVDLSSDEIDLAEADEETDSVQFSVPLDDELDLDMSDVGSSDDDLVASSTDDQSETADADITEFKAQELEEEFSESVPQDEPVVETVDVSTENLEKTGTFAPGDFDDVVAELSSDDITEIEDLMLPTDVDEVSTKLDLAKAFIEMGDAEGARSSLEEVVNEGTDEQKAEATSLLNSIS